MEKKYTDLGFAKLDKDRVRRRGNSEAVFCECKTSEQLIEIFKSFNADGQNVIGTRASKEQYEDLKRVFENIQYNEKGKTLKLIANSIEMV